MPSPLEPIDVIRDPSQVPDLVKRGVMSAMKTVKGNSPREKFDNAFRVVVWRLTEGLTANAKKGWRLRQKSLKLTKTGRQVERAKTTDANAQARIRAFDRLVMELRRDVEREEEAT